MSVALIVDHPYRDLPGLVLVAFRLAQEGVKSFLVPVNLRNTEVWLLAPDFVLLNNLRTVNEGFARQLTEVGIKFGVLDTEGGVVADLDSWDQQLPQDSEVRQTANHSSVAAHSYEQWLAQDSKVRAQVACYCTWGPRQKEYMVRLGLFTHEQVTVTGSPRYDFYSLPWRRVALHASNHAVPYARNLVLVNGNFQLANPSFGSSEADMKLLIEHFGYDREYVLKWREADKRAMYELAELTNRLARRFTEATFVYRPHPFERAETYYSLLEKRENLHLIKFGTVDGWIPRARAVIQRSSSTAIEAGVADVPSLFPAWIPLVDRLPAAEEVSVQCQTEEELMGTLDSILKDDFQLPLRVRRRLDNVVDEWFYRVDGKSHERLVDCILQSLRTNGGSKQPSKVCDIAYRLRRGAKLLKPAASATLRRLFDLPDNWSFRQMGVVPGFVSWEESEKYFGPDHVRALMDLIRECAQDSAERPLCQVAVRPAREQSDYRFGFLPSRSVVVFPQRQ